MQNQQEQKQQSSRYEFYITNNPDIYWWTNSIDKPNKAKFDNIINLSNWIKVNTPNFVNAFTCEFVVDKKDYYNYAKLVDTVENKTTYWFFNSLQRTLRNAFLYQLKMDVFASYGYEFLKQARNRKLNVFVNRSNAYGLLRSSFVNSQVDELLPEFNGVYPLKLKSSKYINGAQRIVYNFTENGDDWSGIPTADRKGLLYSAYYSENRFQIYDWAGINSLTWHIELPMNASVEMNLLCDVYSYNENNIILIPVNNVISKAVGTYKETADSTIEEWPLIFTDTRKSKSMRYHSGWITRYKGCYAIPFFPQLLARCKGLIRIKDCSDAANEECVDYTGGFILPITSAYDLSIPSVVGQMEIKNRFLTYFQSDSNEINEYVLSKFTQMLNGKKWCSYFGDTLLGINEFEYNYIAGINFYTDNNDATNDKDFSISYAGGETLPVITDEYQKYLSSTQATRNTNLEIFNRNADIGIAQSVVGGFASVITGGIMGTALTGNPYAGVASAASGIIDTGFNIAASVNAKGDYIKRLNAELADKKQSLTQSITLSTVEKSNLVNQLNKKPKYWGVSGENNVYQCVIWLNGYNELDTSTIRASNRVIWENGFKIGTSLNTWTIENIIGNYLDTYKKNSFLYWDWKFKDEWFKNIFPTLDSELLDVIKLSVNGEIRFWNIDRPSYNAAIYTR